MSDSPVGSSALVEASGAPVFIIGSPRSGTTALGDALGHHSGLSTQPESDVLFHLLQRSWAENAYRQARSFPGDRWLARHAVSEDEFLCSLGVGLNALFTSRASTARWVDHTPLYTLVAPTIARVFPKGLFVHSLRDGRDVVASMLAFADAIPDAAVAAKVRSDVPWATDLGAAARAWTHHVERALALEADLPGRVLRVRNEDVSRDPASTLRSVLEFLSVPQEPGPAEFLKSQRINSSFGSGRRRAWQSWSADQRDVFAGEAGQTLVSLGYATWESLHEHASP
jgi:protein-tyrosine sulfotransferase